jgi:surfeit locus 1 family protein
LKRDLITLSALTVVAFAMLAGLGVWQLQRLEWKQDLTARIEARMASEPVSLTDAQSLLEKSQDVEYLRVRFKGSFRHDRESHYFTVIDGKTGWRIITPLDTPGGQIVMVERGFVPTDKKQPQTRAQGQIAGEQTVIGLARSAGIKGTFSPDTSLEKNHWFWRDLNGMAAAALPKSDINRLVPFFVEQEVSTIPGGWPRGGVTRVNMPNSHLQYAFTWFGLAAALLGVFVLYLRRRLRERSFT